VFVKIFYDCSIIWAVGPVFWNIAPIGKFWHQWPLSSYCFSITLY